MLGKTKQREMTMDLLWFWLAGVVLMVASVGAVYAFGPGYLERRKQRQERELEQARKAKVWRNC